MMNKKLLFFVTEDWYFCLHWLRFAIGAQKAGYQVTVVTQVSSKAEIIREQGIEVIAVSLSRHGTNPFHESKLLWDLIRIYRQVRPDVVQHVAMKPIVYGSIAALFARVERIINVVAGLGYLFSANTLKARWVSPLIKQTFLILHRFLPSIFIFQNPDSARRIFTYARPRVSVIRGVGVDLERFVTTPQPKGRLNVVLPGRLLWDKGVAEFVGAARYFKAHGYECLFVLVGDPDDGNRSAVPRSDLRRWVQEGVIEWLGFCSDMPALYAQASIVCLPSYHEGLPTVLLEAAACGRPLVATDIPGCRDVVSEAENGFLVPVQDTDSLIKAIKPLLDSPELRQQMGTRGRLMVEQGFSAEEVVGAYIALYNPCSHCAS